MLHNKTLRHLRDEREVGCRSIVLGLDGYRSETAEASEGFLSKGLIRNRFKHLKYITSSQGQIDLILESRSVENVFEKLSCIGSHKDNV